jgi:hypothetical protein
MPANQQMPGPDDPGRFLLRVDPMHRLALKIQLCGAV